MQFKLLVNIYLLVIKLFSFFQLKMLFQRAAPRRTASTRQNSTPPTRSQRASRTLPTPTSVRKMKRRRPTGRVCVLSYRQTRSRWNLSPQSLPRPRSPLVLSWSWASRTGRIQIILRRTPTDPINKTPLTWMLWWISKPADLRAFYGPRPLSHVQVLYTSRSGGDIWY